jgi:hypothetical protein
MAVAVIAACSSLRLLPAQEPAQVPATWSWDAEHVSSAYLELVRSFQAEREDVAGEPESVVVRYWPRFLELAVDGDPDSLLWLLDNADWERARAEPAFADRLRGWTERLLESHGDDFRSQLLAWPILELWWIDGQRGPLLGAVDAYLGRSTYAPGRASVALLLADAMFAYPRDAADQRRAAELYRLAAAESPEQEQRERARRKSDIQERELIGGPAPEIVGRGADGSELRLSSLRGKTVVLWFWGFW